MTWFNANNNSPVSYPSWIKNKDKKVNASSVIIGSLMEYHNSNKEENFTSKEPQIVEPPAPPPEPVPDPRVEMQVEMFNNALSELVSKRNQAQKRDLNFCVELAFTIANELVCGTIMAKPETVKDMAQKALGFFEENDKPIIKMHPQLLEAIKEKEKDDELNQLDVTIKADEQVDKMGCIVESPQITVDARVKTRMERLRLLFEESSGDK